MIQFRACTKPGPMFPSTEELLRHYKSVGLIMINTKVQNFLLKKLDHSVIYFSCPVTCTFSCQLKEKRQYFIKHSSFIHFQIERSEVLKIFRFCFSYRINALSYIQLGLFGGCKLQLLPGSLHLLAALTVY